LKAAAEPRRPFPWKTVMSAGLGHMRLSPRDFWAMSPRELAAALDRSPLVGAAPSRTEFEALMGNYPDQ
jgi:uncharacterized phage protein (TIGR02216 family)